MEGPEEEEEEVKASCVRWTSHIQLWITTWTWMNSDLFMGHFFNRHFIPLEKYLTEIPSELSNILM